MRKRIDNKGFTLAELLIVVAIIAVLVAISIPIFSTQLEKSREATDLANVRSAYAEVMTAAITEDHDATYTGDGTKLYSSADNLYKAVVPLKQRKAGWAVKSDNLTVGGINRDTMLGTNWIGDPSGSESGTCEVSYNPSTDMVILKWDGETVSTPTASATIAGLGTTLRRLGGGWGADSNGLMSIGAASSNESASKVTLTTTPIALAKGATVTIENQDGYQSGYFLMKYDADKGGYVKVVDSGWKSGTITVPITEEGYYLAVNTKKTSENITVAEAQANVKLTITGNENAYSTEGMTATSFSSLDGVTATAGKTLTNSTSSKTGGTLTEDNGYYRGYATVAASEGQILSITAADNAKFAYFFATDDNTVLFDSGWLDVGDETAIVIPQDCKVIIQVQQSGSKMTDESLSAALKSVSIYSK